MYVYRTTLIFPGTFETYGSAFGACHQNCDVTTDLLGRRDSVQGDWAKGLVVVLSYHQRALASLKLKR